MYRSESTVERQIREATERGAFDDLPGKGRPLPGAGSRGPLDENWWIRSYLRREGLDTDALLPPSLQLRKQIDKLPEAVRAVRDERSVRDRVEELNRQIVEYMRRPSGPRVPLRRLDADEVVARWRAERESATPRPTRPAPAPPTRPSWWARLLRRR